ncbi:MAG TPA: glycoside hydrolase family 28 protein, partial [Blastocatellia bacterium]|nr:glycoside hydrolase family 28 protein [Blastocatellia bacterium]
IFLRLGNRLRGPKETTTVGALRRVMISNVVVYNADARYGSIISGIPGHPIEDLKLSNIRIFYQGGGTKEQAALEPMEKEIDYPEPSMFGDMPAYGFFIRHVKGLNVSDVEVSYMKPDMRPAFVLIDVKDADFQHARAQHGPDVPTFVLRDVENFSTNQCWQVPDKRLEHAKLEKL